MHAIRKITRYNRVEYRINGVGYKMYILTKTQTKGVMLMYICVYMLFFIWYLLEDGLFKLISLAGYLASSFYLTVLCVSLSLWVQIIAYVKLLGIGSSFSYIFDIYIYIYTLFICSVDDASVMSMDIKYSRTSIADAPLKTRGFGPLRVISIAILNLDKRISPLRLK